MKIIPAIIAVCLVLVFVVRKWVTRKRKYRRTRAEVAEMLEAFLTKPDGWKDWDDFLSFPLEDEELEKIRLRCAGLDSEFPPEGKGRFCNDRGLEVIRSYVSALRSSAAEK